MRAQFKYSLRAYLTPRAIALSAVLVMCLVFGLLGYNDIYGYGGKVTAVVLSALGLFGILVVCFITDFEMLRGLCTAPAGYVTLLTPVKSWKLILPRVITILVEDMLCLIAGITGVAIQGLIVSGYTGDMFWGEFDWSFLWGLAVILLGYIFLIMIVLFCIVLSKSLFYSRRIGTFLAVLATIATAYVFNLLNFVLAPFGAVDSVGIFYNISLIAGPTLGMAAYSLLSLCKSAALFLASSYLMERKINI